MFQVEFDFLTSLTASGLCSRECREVAEALRVVTVDRVSRPRVPLP